MHDFVFFLNFPYKFKCLQFINKCPFIYLLIDFYGLFHSVMDLIYNLLFILWLMQLLTGHSLGAASYEVSLYMQPIL